MKEAIEQIRTLISKSTHFGILVVVLSYTAIIAYHHDFVPMWDGGWYFNHCLLGSLKRAGGSIPPLSSLSCNGHPSQGYFLWSSLFQVLSPGNLFLLHFSNALLGIFALFAIYFILITSVPRLKSQPLEAPLALSLFAFQPVFLASTLNFNLDFGMACFAAITLAFITAEYYLLAALSGLLLVYSKEFGIILMATFVLLDFLKLLPKRLEFNSPQKRKRGFFLLLVPLGFYSMVLMYSYIYGSSHQKVWNGRTILDYVQDALFRGKRSIITLQFTQSIFILNFHWIVNLVTSLIFGKIIFSRKKISKSPKKQTPNYLFLLVIWITQIGVTLFFAEQIRWINARYFLTIYFFSLVLFVLLISEQIKWQLIRICIYSVLSILFLTSTFYTIDPISKYLFNTFDFGTHEILSFNPKRKDQILGYARDQMVYNLQFIKIKQLQRLMAADFFKERNVKLVMPKGADLFTHYAFDQPSLNYFFRTGKSILPLSDPGPEYPRVWVPVYPNFKTPLFIKKAMELSPNLKLKNKRRYLLNGYEMEILEFEK